MPDNQTILAQACRYVQEGQRHIAEQQARVAALDRDGHDTSPFRAVLATLEESLRLHQDQLAWEEQKAERLAVLIQPGGV
ncbi:hypothetical protein [Geminicoccus harenae]|uniref:hypothetical protein n=1 Tax=Geminicoccus harenae TaxID=2498453 RepID=UPI00168BAF02|nr:hypothetical protein [Geminicoccus harenae]